MPGREPLPLAEAVYAAASQIEKEEPPRPSRLSEILGRRRDGSDFATLGLTATSSE